MNNDNLDSKIVQPLITSFNQELEHTLDSLMKMHIYASLLDNDACDKIKQALDLIKSLSKVGEKVCKTNEYGTKRWFLNGKLHREDGPAVEYTDGYKAWYLNDELHREDGPAVEFTDGYKDWYYHGELITCSSQEEFERLINKKDLPTCETDKYGTKRWTLDDQYHREDGPAIDHCDGYKAWYLYGQRHREDGPAIEYYNGTKVWYYHGKYIDCSSQEEFKTLINK